MEDINLENKILYAENAKEFQCPTCLKYFSRKFTLDMHLLIHKGIKPHPCPFCGKSFRQKGTLMRHKALHSSSNLFHCSLCDRGFRQKNVFLHHLKHRHNVSTETLDRRKYRTELKDYQTIMDTLPPFVMADSTAIASSEKHLDAMLFETMNGGSCESQNTINDYEAEIHNIESDSSNFRDPYFETCNDADGIQELRYECDICLSHFLGYNDYSHHVKVNHNNDINLLDKKPSHVHVSVSNYKTTKDINQLDLITKESAIKTNSVLSNSVNASSQRSLTALTKPNRIDDDQTHIFCHQSFALKDESICHHNTCIQSDLTDVNIDTQTSISELTSVTSNCDTTKESNCMPHVTNSHRKFLAKENITLLRKSFPKRNTFKKSSLPIFSNSSVNFNKNSSNKNISFNSNRKFKRAFYANKFQRNNISNKSVFQSVLRARKLYSLKKSPSFHNNLINFHNNNKFNLINSVNPAFIQKHIENKKTNVSKYQSSGKVICVNPKFYSCKICNKSFKKFEAFEYHRQMHLTVRNFCCGQCKKRFIDKQALLQHTRLTHMKTYECHICSRSFSYFKIYNYHIKNCLKYKSLDKLKSNMNFPLVEIDKLLTSDITGVIGIIPLQDGKTSKINYKIGIPILALEHIKNIAKIPLLSVPLSTLENEI